MPGCGRHQAAEGKQVGPIERAFDGESGGRAAGRERGDRGREAIGGCGDREGRQARSSPSRPDEPAEQQRYHAERRGGSALRWLGAQLVKKLSNHARSQPRGGEAANGRKPSASGREAACPRVERQRRTRRRRRRSRRVRVVASVAVHPAVAAGGSENDCGQKLWFGRVAWRPRVHERGRAVARAEEAEKESKGR